MTSRAAGRGARPGVLLITDDFPIGGLERVVVGLAGALVARGHPVGVFANPGGAMWRHVPAGCERHTAPAGSGAGHALGTLLALRRLARSGRYRVFHAHQRGVALLASLAVRGTGCVVVEHVHNVFPATPAARLLSFRSPTLIACAGAVGRMLVDDFKRPANRVRVVVNGVADPLGRRPAAAMPDGPLILVGAGRMSEQKDPLRFVRTVGALAARRGPNAVRAVWLGDGELMHDARAERARLGLDDILELPGLVDDAASWFGRADCLLLTSRWEGLPLVALETLAVGRGVVLPDVGGCADALDESTGLLYDADLSADQLGELLDRSLTTERLADWAAGARDRFERHFTFERMAEQTVQIYSEALGAGVPTGGRIEAGA